MLSFCVKDLSRPQLVNGSTGGSKRPLEVSISPSPEKKRVRENSGCNQVSCGDE